MDGNGRWGLKFKNSRNAGHREGLNTVEKIIKSSIKLGGSSLRDYVNTEGKMGYFQSTFNVYGREGKICVSKGCSESIKRIVQSNRSSFFCSSCQKK